MIKSWSFSRLQVFQECPYRARLAWIDKMPEPERALPAGKTEHANDRGSRIHEDAENFVRGKGTLTKELMKFQPEFERLKELFDTGVVCLEDEWAFDHDWQSVDWSHPRAWGRLKIDALIRLDPERAVVVDYKTGRKDGNEIKHAKQTQLYALVCFLRDPQLEEIHTELWYLDQNELTRTRYTRKQAMRYLKTFDKGAKQMTSAVEFKPNPNMYTCRWCPYKENICPVAWRANT
jgi:RecB family exonuclease